MKSTDCNKMGVSIAPRTERKPYEKPVLVNYGDIGTMTKNTGSGTFDDGGGGGATKSV